MNIISSGEIKTRTPKAKSEKNLEHSEYLFYNLAHKCSELSKRVRDSALEDLQLPWKNLGVRSLFGSSVTQRDGETLASSARTAMFGDAFLEND